MQASWHRRNDKWPAIFFYWFVFFSTYISNTAKLEGATPTIFFFSFILPPPPRLRLNRQFYFWQKSKTAGCRQKLCFSGKRKGVLLRSNWWNIQSSSAPDNQSKAKARNIILSAAGGSLFSSRRQRGESFLKMTAQLSGDNFQAKRCCYLCCKFFFGFER